MVTTRFVRADTFRLLRLGKKRRKLKKWRRPRGTHNKLRLKRVGHPALPTVGHRSPRKESGKISGLIPKLVHNVNELSKLDKNSIAIIARVGARKKLEIIKKAEEMKIKIINLGVKK